MTHPNHPPLCDHCRRRADTLHFTTRDGGYPQRGDVVVRFCCPRHDDGGYWLYLYSGTDSLVNHFEQWMLHLRGKAWEGTVVLAHWLTTTREGAYVRFLAERRRSA
jgi:hypothetical protein